MVIHMCLSICDKIVGSACRLPERIRPAVCAFGGLTDGFMPFHLPGGDALHLELASVVMKAVQARTLYHLHFVICSPHHMHILQIVICTNACLSV